MIAVIAGTGTLPVEACKNLRTQQKPFFVVALFPEVNTQELVQAVGASEIITQDVYKPGTILSLLKSKLTTHVLFIGKVDKTNLLKHLKLDWLAVKLLGSLVYKSDKDIMESLLAELERHNIKTIRQDEVLGRLLVPPGVLAGTLTPELEKNIKIGLTAAQAIAHADIGQTVIVKDSIIIAVEAIEGTDQCIKRGIELGKNNIIICKAARTDQNKKFDLPTLGSSSLASYAQGQIIAIAWISRHTLIAQKEEFIKKANALGITLVSVDQNDI